MNSVDFLDKLLDGVVVEWKEVGEVAQILNGFAFESTKYSSSGIRVIRISDVQKGKMSDKDMKFYPANTADEINKYLLREDDLVMSLTGNVGRVAMLSKTDLPAALNQRVACIRVNEEKTFTRYLFHFFDQLSFETEAMANATGGGQKNMSTKWLSSYKIPIPCPDNPKKSLEIQAEIVRILDAFTELTAELTAELNLRKKQYNYYRDQLLSFEGAVEWKTLGSILTMKAGQHLSASRISDVASDGFIYPCFGGNGVRGYVKEKSHSGEYLLVGRQGALCGNVQRMKGDFYATEHAVVVTVGEDVNVDFAFHMLTLMNLNQYASQSAQPGLAVGKLEGLKMPVPSLAEQVRIAGILDKFDALTNSLTEGLPREIELRQKQYAYYRDLLLSFPKPEEAAA